uniref:Uncharacterized protein n=2 Tax=Lotharella globosa TaxID=91324 RepID=A0A7S4DLY5_9EUKA
MVSVSPKDSAAAAFQKLMSTRWTRKSNFDSTGDEKCVWDLSALPILDSKSHVVNMRRSLARHTKRPHISKYMRQIGTISQSDLRGIKTENLHEVTTIELDTP